MHGYPAHKYPFLLVDALVIRVPEAGWLRQCSALIASGVHEKGLRERLGLQVGESASEASWSALFVWLKGRGLWGVDLVTSDDQGGLVCAGGRHFEKTSWQRCQTHFARNVLESCPEKEPVALKGWLPSDL